MKCASCQHDNRAERRFCAECRAALARAEVALDHDTAVDPLLARGEALSAEMRALAFRPHLAEIRAARARRHGDQVAWRAQLAEAHRLFVETRATGHADGISRQLSAITGEPPDTSMSRMQKSPSRD